jgi:hypothetical protein
VGWSVPVLTGLDFSIDAAHAACGALAFRRSADRFEAPFANGSCAAVTMFHVLEHLYDPGEYLPLAIFWRRTGV